MKSRPCMDCGKLHNMVIENTATKEVEQYLDKCYDCIFKECRYEPIKEHITIEAMDINEQPIADQMTKLYNNFVSNYDIKEKKQ